ncbi:hypothetical protein OG921_05020 [Aldersonia sp. NBC_00410]|uniref:hypothetical protein n=1 Tax=Aldersonia sp. NBC_00410 TaxID=2975954 RepID=UPI002252AE05|nr:hypothetical protein [Aldersonia sp. NBC_00410]MCX5042530.1 hypothetical protein [Aldersonia sp. NBC_00410]
MPDEMPTDHYLRLMNDYCCIWPLWDSLGGTDGKHLGLTEELEHDIRKWQEHFEAHFHYETGWSSAQTAAEYERRGRDLLPRLSAELPDHFVELDLWPVNGGKVRG